MTSPSTWRSTVASSNVMCKKTDDDDDASRTVIKRHDVLVWWRGVAVTHCVKSTKLLYTGTN